MNKATHHPIATWRVSRRLSVLFFCLATFAVLASIIDIEVLSTSAYTWYMYVIRFAVYTFVFVRAGRHQLIAVLFMIGNEIILLNQLFNLGVRLW